MIMPKNAWWLRTAVPLGGVVVVGWLTIQLNKSDIEDLITDRAIKTTKIERLEKDVTALDTQLTAAEFHLQRVENQALARDRDISNRINAQLSRIEAKLDARFNDE